MTETIDNLNTLIKSFLKCNGHIEITIDRITFKYTVTTELRHRHDVCGEAEDRNLFVAVEKAIEDIWEQCEET